MSTRVVIAEDEAIVRLDLREILEEEGYEVVGETGRGDEALRLIEEHRPDLALLDIKMPGLDGLSVARQVGDDVAVVVLTAFSQRTAIEEARDAGVAAYLIKPFQRSELVPALEVALVRFRETQPPGEEDRLALDKAKATLMDVHGLSEGDAIAFLSVDDADSVARAHSVVKGDLRPE